MSKKGCNNTFFVQNCVYNFITKNTKIKRVRHIFVQKMFFFGDPIYLYDKSIANTLDPDMRLNTQKRVISKQGNTDLKQTA